MKLVMVKINFQDFDHMLRHVTDNTLWCAVPRPPVVMCLAARAFG